MIEDVFFRNHVKPFLEKYGTFDRLENLLGSVPDISYTFRDAAVTHGWLETKILKNNHLFFQKFQLPWFSKRLKITNKGLWILATDGFRLFLFHPREIIEGPKTIQGRWTTVDIKPLTNHIPLSAPWPWGKVYQKLANE